ncbi:MAG: hypothetical protein RLZZ528_1155 [Pseudomonadota bacterium]|jgi:uncharacterized protein YndB with AHSA1/START domain
MTDLTLTARRIIKAPPERVFNAWLDPAMMMKFMSPGPDVHVSEARADARVGGRFLVVMVADRDLPHEGTYTEITRHSRLAFTWESPWSAPDTLVTIDFTPVPGGTDVVLTHVKFLSEESRDGHFKGWTGILEKLEAAMA